MMFVGRENELRELEERYGREGAQLVVLYGKRRLGKTALLREFARNKAHLFYVSRETIDSEQIRLFSQEVLKDSPVGEYLASFDSWEKAFRFLSHEAKGRRILLIIDEFPYMAQNNKELLSILQNIWDQEEEDSRLMLVLTGSSLSYMEEQVLGEESPLYGRTSASIRLEALTFREAALLLPGFGLEDQLAAFAILGGIPRYLRSLDQKISFRENMEQNLLNPYSFLSQEVSLLMREDLREPSTYYAILSAIAAGNTAIKDIAGATGLDKTKVNVYLKSLMQLNIISKAVPLLLPGEKGNQHRSMYRFLEPYFRFYFRYMIPNLSLAETLPPVEFYKACLEESLNSFIEEAFQDAALQLLKERNAKGQLAITCQEIGTMWNDKVRLDIFGFSQDGAILSGKAFYQRIPSHRDIEEIRQKVALYTGDPTSSPHCYLILSREPGPELHQLESLDPTLHLIILPEERG